MNADPPNPGTDLRDTFQSLVRSIDTGKYVPAHLSCGADRSLWSFGTQGGVGDYLTVRKYSLDGNQTGAYLPRSLFPHGLEPGSQTSFPAWSSQTTTQVYRLNRALSIWEPVNTPHAILYGADRDKLVFADWTGSPMHMSWFPQP